MAVELVFQHKPKWLLNLNDSFLMIKRSSRHIIRNRDQLLGAFFQPIMFLLLFSAVLAARFLSLYRQASLFEFFDGRYYCSDGRFWFNNDRCCCVQ